MAKPNRQIDIQAKLGAKPARTQAIVIYLPDKYKHGKRVRNHKEWVRATRDLLTEINGGATVMPPAAGAWRNEETATRVNENTIVVYSFIRGRSFVDNIGRLRDHRFGRQTKQGVVALEFGHQYFEIENFDES